MRDKRRNSGAFKRKTAAFAAIGFLLTGAALLPVPASAATGFTDVADGYWAEKDIAAAAASGIVNGYEVGNGTHIFCPENSVSYEEAATMLYRALSAAGKIEKSAASVPGNAETTGAATSALVQKHAAALSAAGVATWAQEYVAYGLEHQIIEEKELASFVDPVTKAGNPAPRITVAVWTAKALGKPLAGAYYLPFTDASQIDDAFAPYVDMLYRHGIMKGSWQPDGSIAFQPQAGVRRSEFAAISNRVLSGAGAAYDFSKESYHYTVAAGETVPNAKLRLAANARMIGITGKPPEAVSGMTFAAGETPQVHLVGAPQVETGTIKSVKTLADSIVQVGIENGKSGTIYYIFDENTRSTAKIQNGANITFLADGIHLIEVQ